MLIHLEVRYSGNILCSLTVLSDDRFSEFLTLARERVSSHMAQKGDVKHRMNLHEFRSFNSMTREFFSKMRLTLNGLT